MRKFYIVIPTHTLREVSCTCKMKNHKKKK